METLITGYGKESQSCSGSAQLDESRLYSRLCESEELARSFRMKHDQGD